MRTTTRFWSVCTPHTGRYAQFSGRLQLSGYVCGLTPLAGDCGYSRHKVSLWQTCFTVQQITKRLFFG